MWILFLVISLSIVLFYGSYSIRNSFYVKSFCGINTKEKIIAITFDDGIDSVHTPKILDVLKEFKVKATFFIIGSKVVGNEEILKRIIDEGHLIGNHTFSHKPIFPLFSFKNMLSDIQKCKNILDEYTETNLFRPPFGVTNPTISKSIKELGYRSIGWSIRSLDTNTDDIEKTYNRILKRLKGGDIILLHDRLKNSDKLLKKLLLFLKENKYKVCTVSELLEK
ncbi:MAG: polysaccharide deacetylase family protein [Marinifilaceae bacterium]